MATTTPTRESAPGSGEPPSSVGGGSLGTRKESGELGGRTEVVVGGSERRMTESGGPAKVGEEELQYRLPVTVSTRSIRIFRDLQGVQKIFSI